MARRHMLRGRIDMAGLVVKEEVGFELAQKLALRQTTEEHGFVDLDVPVHEGADGPLMRRCTARRDQRRAYAHAGSANLLQAVQGFKQGLEGAGQQRLCGLVALMRLEGRQAV